MADIQTTRDHDKDMLIAGFKYDLAKAQTENERMRSLLRQALDSRAPDYVELIHPGWTAWVRHFVPDEQKGTRDGQA